MESTGEKRNDRRYACRARVEWSYFNQSGGRPGMMLNFSREGVALETEESLVEGASVVMRLAGDAAGCRPDCDDTADECPWPRSMLLGHVKWSRRLSGPGPRWGAGLKIYSR